MIVVKEFIKKRKLLVVLLIILFIVSVSGGGFYFYLFQKSKKAVPTKAVEPEAKDTMQAVFASLSGTVEIRSKNDSKWEKAEQGQKISTSDLIKTGENSYAIIVFPNADIIILDASSEAKIAKHNEIGILVEQVRGKTYSRVEKKENQTYTVAKRGAKVTALGTEFLVDTPANPDRFNLYVFRSRVMFKYTKGNLEVAELNSALLDMVTQSYTSAPLSDVEKLLSKPFLDLLTQKQPEIAKAQEAVGVKKSAILTNASIGQAAGSADDGTSGGGGSSGGSNPPPSVWGSFSNSSVEGIVNALPLVKDDVLGDYNQPGGGGPPGGVYPYSPIDLDNLYMGVSSGRLYIRWTLGGAIPTGQQTVNGNVIKTVTYNVKVSTEANPSISNNCGGTATFLQINIAFHDNGQIWYNPWFNSICTNSGPYQSDHDWAFARTGNGLAHTYNSGIGKNTIVWSYALSDLGNNFGVGDTVKLDFYSEAQSNLYEHYSYEDNSRAWPSWVVAGI